MVVVRIACCALLVAALAGCTPSSSSAPRSPTPAVSMWVIGDSWAAGLYADPARALGQVAADRLGWSVHVDAESGSGYLDAPSGTRVYSARAAAIPMTSAPDIVVVQGGSNDADEASASAAAFAAAVAATVRTIRERAPDATVVLLGPGPDPWPTTSSVRSVDRAIGSVGRGLDATVISMLDERWITESNVDRVIDPENHHPTVDGDRYLGARLSADLIRIVARA